MTNEELLKKIQWLREQGIPDNVIDNRLQQQFGKGLADVKPAGFVEKLVREVVKPAWRGVAPIGEAVRQVGALATSPAYRKSVAGKPMTLAEAEEVQRVAQPKFLTEKETERIADKPVSEAIKRSAGVMSYGVPVGKTFKAATGLGALAGGLRGVSEEDATPGSVIGTAGLGGILGGGIFGAGKALGWGGEKLSKVREALGKKGAESYLKTSRAPFQKAIEEHGLDLRSLVKEHVPAGASYDDMLGAVGARGKGGYIKDALNAAESEIKLAVKTSGLNVKISGDDIIQALDAEGRVLRSSLGGGTKAGALGKIIEQAQKKYSGGVTVGKAMRIIREANSKFGKAIVEEGKGAVASSAQKLEANTLKRVVKGMFPEIADALRTQEGLLTLRPVLNAARAKGAVGGLRGLAKLDVSKPGTLVTPLLGKEGITSRLAQLGASKGGATKALQAPALQKAGVQLGTPMMRALSADHPSTRPSTRALQEIATPATQPMISQENVAAAMLQDLQLTGGKNISKIEKIHKFAGGAEADKPSIEQAKYENLARSGERALDTVADILEADPLMLTKRLMPGDLLSRQYEAAAFAAADAILRMRTGAAAPEAEIKRYIDEMMPRFGDNQQAVSYKIDRLYQDFHDVLGKY